MTRLKMMINQITIMVFIIALSACGGGKDNSLPKSTLTKLEGTWIASCTPVTLISIEGKMIISNDQFTLIQMQYSNKVCSGRPDNVGVVTGNFNIGASVTTSSGVTAEKIDLNANNGVSQYNIFYLERDKLYFGAASNTPENRPNAIDFSVYSTRQ